ncbi:MAG: protein kinase domain-containing protein [Acidimicrobiales bacterium]
MAEQSGTRLGHYRLIEPIGTGGFATVYRAVDERLESEVAVKVLAENHALDIEIRERFLAEARALRRVACDAVVPVYDIGETDRAQPFIVLAYADRGDLRDRVTKRAAAGMPVDPDDLLTVAETLAIGLGRAHRVGLVHRDVKPTNLLISSSKGEARGRPLGRSTLLASDERLLLGDLGLAKDVAASSGLTVGAGTHGFSAPEQRTGLSQVDARADIYGASAVLYWMATAVLPVDDDDERAQRLTAARLPADLTRAIGVGLATEPSRRFSMIEEWLGAMSLEQPRRQGAIASEQRPGTGLPTLGRLPAAKGSETDTTSATPGAEATAAGPGGSIRVGRRAAAVGAAFAAVCAAGITWAMLRDVGPEATELDDGRLQLVEQQGSATVAVTGPTTVAVGEPATFEASAEGVASFRWFAPDGSVESTNPLVLQSSAPGDATVTLVASTEDGDMATVTFTFTVLE